MNNAPFYPGQTVVAIDAIKGSILKNGCHYIVDSCEYVQSSNPLAEGEYFWYVGVEGSHNRLRPAIFLDEVMYRAINNIKTEIGI